MFHFCLQVSICNPVPIFKLLTSYWDCLDCSWMLPCCYKRKQQRFQTEGLQKLPCPLTMDSNYSWDSWQQLHSVLQTSTSERRVVVQCTVRVLSCIVCSSIRCRQPSFITRWHFPKARKIICHFRGSTPCWAWRLDFLKSFLQSSDQTNVFRNPQNILKNSQKVTKDVNFYLLTAFSTCAVK